MAEQTIYQLQDVSLAYQTGKGQSVQALQSISLQIKVGERWAIIGPSGSGKSSLLYLLSGLLRPQSGKVYYLGAPLKNVQQDIAVILQDYGLFPWKNVFHNVALGLTVQKKNNRLTKAKIKQKVEGVLVQLGLADQGKKYPSQLSGGQKQRVAIARALVLQPKVLLMDEPFAALDAITKENLEGLLLDICQEQGLTLVFVTHNIEEAMLIGEKIAIFGQEPGKIVQQLENPLAHIEIGEKKGETYYAFHEKLRAGLGIAGGDGNET